MTVMTDDEIEKLIEEKVRAHLEPIGKAIAQAEKNAAQRHAVLMAEYEKTYRHLDADKPPQTVQ